MRASEQLEGAIHGALSYAGPVLTRIVTDYGKRPIRWVEAARDRFTDELTTEQKIHFLARLGGRSLQLHPNND